MTSIQLAVDARNPGEYLAVCGLVEVIGRFDPKAMSGWMRSAGFVQEVSSACADVCEIDADIDESSNAKELGAALGARSAWNAVTESGRVPLADALGVWTAGIELVLPSKDIVVIDHWYERAHAARGRIVQRLEKRDGKSRWKFWAGQQDEASIKKGKYSLSKKGIAGLVLDLVDAAGGMGDAKRLQHLLAFASAGGSRLNIDAATTRSSIDRGISANDAAAGGDSPGRPVLELLAAIGLSAFFPPRRYGASAPDGVVGVEKRAFRYCTWSPRAPLSIARLAARGADVAPIEQTGREATIGMMGQYSYLKFARPAGVTEPDRPADDLVDEEDTDE